MSIAGIVVGMAVMAALLGAACFLLGRRAAREAALAAADGGRDVEVSVCHGSTPSQRRWRYLCRAK